MTSDDYARALEDVARWLETQTRIGRLSQRVDLADRLRDGTWRDMPVRSTATRDVPEARALHRLSWRKPLTEQDRQALAQMRARDVARAEREARVTERMVAAFRGEVRP